jgi:hypothetical protein
MTHKGESSFECFVIDNLLIEKSFECFASILCLELFVNAFVFLLESKKLPQKALSNKTNVVLSFHQ